LGISSASNDIDKTISVWTDQCMSSSKLNSQMI
jgi:hypothetical protein